MPEDPLNARHRLCFFTLALLDQPEHLARWQEWFRQMGMDPNDVAVPGQIFRDTERWRLAVEVYVRDENGQLDGTRATQLFQLEAPPPLFPELA